MTTININDLNLIRACRCAYSWSGILPPNDCADFGQGICQCWKAGRESGDMHDLMIILNLFRFEIGKVEGAHTAYREFSEALAKVEWEVKVQVSRVVCSWCDSEISSGSEPATNSVCPSCEQIYFPE